MVESDDVVEAEIDPKTISKAGGPRLRGRIDRATAERFRQSIQFCRQRNSARTQNAAESMPGNVSE